MILYLSGPMTGLPDNNFPAFNATAAALRAGGFTVVNPAEIDPGVQATSSDFYNACLRADLRAMLDCEAIAMMDGWERSSGANLELQVAYRVGMQVLFVRDLLPSPDLDRLRVARAYCAHLLADPCFQTSPEFEQFVASFGPPV